MNPRKENLVGRDQVLNLLRNLRWMISISLLISWLLYAPDQVHELYRVLATDSTWLGEIAFFVPLASIAGLIWFGSFVLVRMTLVDSPPVSPQVHWIAMTLPVVLSVLPLIACASAFIGSIPYADPDTLKMLNEVGNPFRDYYENLAANVGHGLRERAFLIGLLSALCAILTLGIQLWLNRSKSWLVDSDVPSWWSLLLTIAAITVLTIAFLCYPVRLPQILGSFGIIAAFTFCVTAFVVQFGLLTMRRRLPMIALAIVAAGLFGYFDLNDNHAVRAIDSGKDAVRASTLPTASTAFLEWYENRPDLDSFPDGYPVYVVTAQGGGIYAAYQAATTLSRMQDYIPNFRDHLFAISSVSGGSVGAGIFATLLHDEALSARARSHTSSTAITRFLQMERLVSGRELSTPAVFESAARKILEADFISPLVTASLFGDFTQKFLFFPIGLLDRARSLEFALEEAGRSTLKDDLTENHLTLLDQPFLRHWNTKNSSPALLINATDAASGRRVLIAPFYVGGEKQTEGTFLDFGYLRTLANQGTDNNSGDSNQDIFQFRLSTAVFISARFPWLTPAATIPLGPLNPKNRFEKMRLVDGGYVDNSGVETALDLRNAISQAVETINTRAKNGDLTANGEKYVKVHLHLIALTGGDYPVRDSYSLGEELEPLRALLSTRASRAYAAIDTAARELPKSEYHDLDEKVPEVMLVSDFRKATVGNRYYPLPLGWAISRRTGELIAKQSGIFLNCTPNLNYVQTSQSLSDGDCVQLLTYHELNRSMKSAASEVTTAYYVNNFDPAQPIAPERFDHQRFLNCYERYEVNRGEESLTTLQANNVNAMLRGWDRRTTLTDDRWLSYLLAIVTHHTYNFRLMTEFISFNSPEKIYNLWKKHFRDVDDAAQFVNKPRELANRVYGGRFGNVAGSDDGWTYRQRGLYKLIGRAQYSDYAQQLNIDLINRPELILNRDIATKVTFAVFLDGRDGNLLKKYFNETTDDWLGARRVAEFDEASGRVAAEVGKMFLGCINEASRSVVQGARAR
jgi:predicted chitinase